MVTTPISRSQKIDNVEFCTEDVIKKTCTSCIIKLSTKAKNAKKVPSNLQKTFFLEQSLKIKNLIIQLKNFLEAWDEDDKNIKVIIMQTREEIEPGHKDYFKILIAKINLANIAG